MVKVNRGDAETPDSTSAPQRPGGERVAANRGDAVTQGSTSVPPRPRGGKGQS